MLMVENALFLIGYKYKYHQKVGIMHIGMKRN